MSAVRFAGAEEGMREALMRLYRTVFSDSETNTALVFDAMFSPGTCFTALDGDTPVAMLFSLPASLIVPGGSLSARYYYAVATLPEARGQGLATRLMDFADEAAKAQGAALSALRPAEESLFSFYGQRGFSPLFSVKRADVVPSGSGLFPLVAMDIAELYGARERFFGGRAGFFRWDDRMLRRFSRLFDAWGIKILKNPTNPLQPYAICYKIEDIVVVLELGAPSPSDRDLWTNSLCRYFGATRCRLTLPGDSDRVPGVIAEPFAMARPISPEGARWIHDDALRGTAYLNITLE